MPEKYACIMHFHACIFMHFYAFSCMHARNICMSEIYMLEIYTCQKYLSEIYQF